MSHHITHPVIGLGGIGQPSVINTIIPTGACGYGTYVDGCLAAPANGQFKLNNCWTPNGTPNDIRLSPVGVGQIWDTSTSYAGNNYHPPDYDVPGCDYAIGPTTPMATMLADQANYDPLYRADPVNFPFIYSNPKITAILPSWQGGTITSSVFSGTIGAVAGKTYSANQMCVTTFTSGPPLAPGMTLYIADPTTGKNDILLSNVQIGSFAGNLPGCNGGTGGVGLYNLTLNGATPAFPTTTTILASNAICQIANPADGSGTSFYISYPLGGALGTGNFTGWWLNQNEPMFFCHNAGFSNQLSNLFMGEAWGHLAPTFTFGNPFSTSGITFQNDWFPQTQNTFNTGQVWVLNGFPSITYLSDSIDGTVCRQTFGCFAGFQAFEELGTGGSGSTTHIKYTVIKNHPGLFTSNNPPNISDPSNSLNWALMGQFIFENSVLFSCATSVAMGHSECFNGAPNWGLIQLSYNLMVADEGEGGGTTKFHLNSTGFNQVNVTDQKDHNVVVVNTSAPNSGPTIYYYLADSLAMGCPTNICPPGSSVYVLVGTTPTGGSLPYPSYLHSGQQPPGYLQLEDMVSGDGHTIPSSVGFGAGSGFTTMFLVNCGPGGGVPQCPPTERISSNPSYKSFYDNTTGYFTLYFDRAPMGSIPPPTFANPGISLSLCTATGTGSTNIGLFNTTLFPVQTIPWTVNSTITSVVVKLAPGLSPNSGDPLIITPGSCMLTTGNGGYYAATITGSAGAPLSSGWPSARTVNSYGDFGLPVVNEINYDNWYDTVGLYVAVSGLWGSPGSCMNLNLSNNHLFYTPALSKDPNSLGSAFGNPNPGLGCHATDAPNPNWWLKDWTTLTNKTVQLLNPATTTYCQNWSAKNTHQISGVSIGAMYNSTNTSQLQQSIYAAGIDSGIPMWWGLDNARIAFTPLTSSQISVVMNAPSSTGGTGTITTVGNTVTITPPDPATLTVRMPGAASTGDLIFTPKVANAGGGAISVKLNAPSGAGTATYVSTTFPTTLTLTPPSTATTAALVSAWINSTGTSSALIVSALGGSGTTAAGIGTAPTLSTTNLAAWTIENMASSSAGSLLKASWGFGNGLTVASAGSFMVGYPGLGSTTDGITFTPTTVGSGNGLVQVKVLANSGAGSIVVTNPVVNGAYLITITPPTAGWTASQIVTTKWATSTGPVTAASLLTPTLNGPGANPLPLGTIGIYTEKPVGTPIISSGVGMSKGQDNTFPDINSYAWTTTQPTPANQTGLTTQLNDWLNNGGLKVNAGDKYYHCLQVNPFSNSVNQVVTPVEGSSANPILPAATMQFTGTYGTWPNYSTITNAASIFSTNLFTTLYMRTSDKNFP